MKPILLGSEKLLTCLVSAPAGVSAGETHELPLRVQLRAHLLLRAVEPGRRGTLDRVGKRGPRWTQPGAQ